MTNTNKTPAGAAIEQQLEMSSHIRSRWGTDWHREGRDQSTYNSAYNDILDLGDTIDALQAALATATAQHKQLVAERDALAAEVAEHRRHVATVMQRESQLKGELGGLEWKHDALATKVKELEQQRESDHIGMGMLYGDINNLRLELAALRAEPRYVPVSDGMVFHETDNVPAEWNYPAHTESIAFLEVRNNGGSIACGSMPKEDEHEANLPDGYRLCRLVPGQDTQQPNTQQESNNE